MCETVPLPRAASSKVLWDTVPRHWPCSLVPAVLGLQELGFARGHGGGTMVLLGLLVPPGCSAGGIRRQWYFGGIMVRSVAGVGCSGSTITPGSSRTPVLGLGNNSNFLSGSLGCHKIPQERAVTPQNVQVDASVSPFGDHLCPA